MLHGEKPQGTEAPGRQHPAGRSALAPGDNEAGTDDLKDRWNASQADIAESIQILEALFQKFDIDPALARELGAAVTQLGEELLASENVPSKRPRELN